MSEIDRIATGISGLDNMIGGGLPFPSLILVSGDAGSGKTTFCMQFLCKGGKLNETGLYFMTFGGPPEWIFKCISSYEFVEQKYFGSCIKFIDLGDLVEKARRAEDVLDQIRIEIEQMMPKRVVIDGLSVMEDVLRDDYRRFLLKLSKMIKDMKVSALITGDAMAGIPYPKAIGNIADGIILLHNVEVNLARIRSIEILKLRGTSHPSGKHVVDISSKGLTIYPGLQL